MVINLLIFITTFLLQETINDHKSALGDATNDYIDTFLHEMKHQIGNSNSTFTGMRL